MAMNGNGMGDEVVDAIVAMSPGYGSFSDAEKTAVKNYWRAICTAIVTHIQTNAKLNFVAAEILVNPGSFTSPAGPVTGQGQNATVALKGSIS